LKKYIYTIICCLPVTAFFNFLFYLSAGINLNSLIAFKVCIWNLVFTLITLIAYEKIKSIGLAIFLVITLFAAIGSIHNEIYFGIACIIPTIFLVVNIKKLKYIKSKVQPLLLAYTSVATFILIIIYFPVGYINSGLIDSVYSGYNINTDSVYHISIAAMIKGYGAVSHGLHGLSALEYHFGSHYILASLSNLLDISAFHAYAFIYPYFFIPLFNISILIFIEKLKPSEGIGKAFTRLAIYLACLISFGIFNQGSILNNFGVWSSFYVSESYLISLILLFSLLSILLDMVINVRNLIIIMIILVAILITKVSTGLIAVGAIILFIIYYRSSKIFSFNIDFKSIFSVTLFGIIFLIFIKYTVNGSEGAYISPFYFINTYVISDLNFWSKLPLFLIIHFSFSWLAIYSLWFYMEVNDVIPIWYKLTLIFSLLVGIFFITAYYIQGGSNYYFSNISMFLSLPLLVLYFEYLIIKIKKKNYFYILIFIFILIYTPSVIKNSIKAYFIGLKSVRHESPISYYINELELFAKERNVSEALIYIPRSEGLFWGALDCRTMPFIIPAISGIPAIYAWPKSECFDWLCGPRFHSNGLCGISGDVFSDSQLLYEASRLGFSSVIVITKDGPRILKSNFKE